jgi:hypothetical protein
VIEAGLSAKLESFGGHTNTSDGRSDGSGCNLQAPRLKEPTAGAESAMTLC